MIKKKMKIVLSVFVFLPLFASENKTIPFPITKEQKYKALKKIKQGLQKRIKERPAPPE